MVKVLTNLIYDFANVVIRTDDLTQKVVNGSSV